MLEYGDLRTRGLERIEDYASHTWTDYNVHDPGITILEHLCYGLTDLSYRTAHDLPDLLTNDRNEPSWRESALFTAKHVLPCRPITLRDFRKVLIDHPGVKNAWLAPSKVEVPVFFDVDLEELTTDPNDKTVEAVDLRGLFRVMVEFEDETLYDDSRSAELESALAEIRRYIHGFRNLCEDFVPVEAVPIELIGVCAELELAEDADTEAVLAEILFELGRAISPSVRFHSREDLEDRGRSSDEIFNGPLLARGFIDDDELAAADRKSEIHLSDLVQVIFDVEGVEAVRRLEATSYDMEGNVVREGAEWILPLDPEKAARFSPGHGRFTIYKRDIPFVANAQLVDDKLEELSAGERQRRLPSHDADYPLRLGRFRNPEEYYSIQREFPLNYGIGEGSLGASEPDLRHAQALQLKGFLVILEQYMANYLAQLTEFGRLFSLDDLHRTYWGQRACDVPDLEKVMCDKKEALLWIHSLLEDPMTFARRRNAILDHLASRFGFRLEEFAFVARVLYERRAEERIVRDKTRFIRHLPKISRDRSAGYDLLAPPPTGASGDSLHLGNVSGLEKNLNALLGVEPMDRFAETVRSRVEYFEEDSGSHRFRILSRDGVPLLLSAKIYDRVRDAETDVAQVLFLGRFRDNYVPFVGEDDTLLFRLVDDDGRRLARAPEGLASEEARLAAIRDLVDFFESEPPEERVYVVEHILLRPRESEQARTARLLPPCLENDEICPGRDPYSFRISVILPYWPWRFRNMHFRRYLERTIREHTPSHVAVRICWIAEQDMDAFEDSYWPWRNALATDAPDLPEKQDRFVEVWSRLRSVFPHATLHDCVEGEDENPVVLDNTTLGTFLEGEDDED